METEQEIPIKLTDEESNEIIDRIIDEIKDTHRRKKRTRAVKMRDGRLGVITSD